MNMNKMKDESILAWFILLAIFVSDVVAQLTISMESAIKPTNSSSFLVSCTDEKGRPIKWRGPKGPLGPNTRPKVEKHSYWTGITFKKTQLNDAGNYECFVSENEKKVFHLGIDAPPEFVDTPTEQAAVEGSDFTIRCEVKNGRALWVMKNNTLTDINKYEQIGDGLLIKNVQRNDSNVYTCQALKDSLGFILPRHIQFRVLHKPVPPDGLVYAKEEVVYGYVGGYVNLTCVAVGYPDPDFTWEAKKKKTQIGQVISVNASTSVLRLHIMNNSTFGEYKCTAANEYGKLNVHFSLEEGSKPNPPKSFELVEAKSTALELEIVKPDPNEDSAQQGMEPIGFLVHYKGVEAESWDLQEVGLSEDNVYTVDGLNADTDYEVKISTKNAAGFSDSTDAKMYKTTKSGGSRIYLSTYCALLIVMLVPIWKYPGNIW